MLVDDNKAFNNLSLYLIVNLTCGYYISIFYSSGNTTLSSERSKEFTFSGSFISVYNNY